MSNEIDNFEDLGNIGSGRKILIFGPPGSGKTHFLIERIVENVKSKKYNILILSFTRAAVQEIKKRLMDEKRIGLIDFFKLQIMTFDQFATRLIYNNINPGENYIKKVINGNSRLKYMGVKMKSIFLY